MRSDNVFSAPDEKQNEVFRIFSTDHAKTSTTKQVRPRQIGSLEATRHTTIYRPTNGGRRRVVGVPCFVQGSKWPPTSGIIQCQ